MVKVLIVFFKLLYAIFESYWRRWFGGWHIGGESKAKAIYNQRWFQHVLGSIVSFLAIWLLCDRQNLVYFDKWLPTAFKSHLNVYVSIYITAILQGLYWARAHGPAFDMSRDGKPDETLIKRYKKEWWNKICEFIVPNSQWYGYGYDFWWMMLRYTIYPVLMIPVFGFSILFMGLLVPVIYSVTWSLFEKYPDTFKRVTKNLPVHNATSLAEMITGLTTGLFLMFI